MNYFQYQRKRPLKNVINQNLFKKKNIIPKPQNTNQNLYYNYMTNYNQNTKNSEKFTKIIPNNYEHFISSYNLNSYGNIKRNNYKDFDLLKIKMSFDLINQKIINMENIIHSLNEQDTHEDEKKNKMNKIYLRNKIRNRKELAKNKENNINKNQSLEKLGPYQNIFQTHHNYSVRNLKNKSHHNNYDYFNDSNIDKNIYYNNYNSLQTDKSRTLDNPKYNSCYNLNLPNFNNNSIYNVNENEIYINYNKSSHSLNNHHIQNQKRIISKKIIANNNFFDKIKKKQILKNYKNTNHNIPEHTHKYTLNNLINNKKFNNNTIFYNINDKSNRINKSIGEYFGSFDDYFLSDTQPIPKSKILINNDNNTNNNSIKTNASIKRKKNKNNTNFNIYNIVKNDKIIQNNYYECKNEAIAKNNNNSKLMIDNQNTLSYLINNKNISNKKGENKSDKKNIKSKSARNKFILNDLQKCSTTDLFLPAHIETKIKLNLNNNIITGDSIQIKKDKINNNNNNNSNNNKIIQNNESKLNYGKYKDDFEYDLIAEKIIDIKKVNNSYDEIHLFPKIRKKYNDKFEKILLINKKEKIKTNNKKSVKFIERDNRIIKINQKDIASKFEVLNDKGKKIYYPKCNINNYLKKLKDKNLKMKSILVNKKEEFIDNSEWDKLYDIINKIAKKSGNNSINKKKFNIKNIESFKKKGKKSFVKKGKFKK